MSGRVSRAALTTVAVAVWHVACGSQSSPATTQPATTAAALQAPAAAQGVAGDAPDCQVACSPTKPRTVVATITWPLTQAAANPQALSAGMTEQHLDVTTFKDGFSRGVFAQLTPVRENQPFALQAPQAEPSGVPSLRALSVTRVSTLQERISSGAVGADTALMPPSAANDPNRVVVIEVEGLEPGLNYFWRRTPNGPVARCQAPVCPADARGR